MVKYVALGILLILPLGGCNQVLTETNDAAATDSEAVVIGIVDYDRVAAELGLSAQVSHAINARTQQYREQIEEFSQLKASEIEAKKTEYGESPTEEQVQELNQMSLIASQTLRGMQAEATKKMKNLQNDLHTKVRNRFAEPVKKVAKENGLQVVMSKNMFVVYTLPSADVTDDVIEILRAENAAAKSGAQPPSQPPAQVPPAGDTVPPAGGALPPVGNAAPPAGETTPPAETPAESKAESDAAPVSGDAGQDG